MNFQVLKKEYVEFHKFMLCDGSFSRYIVFPIIVGVQFLIAAGTVVAAYNTSLAFASSVLDAAGVNHNVAQRLATEYVRSVGVPDAAILCGYAASGGVVKCTIAAAQPNKLFLMPIVCPEKISLERTCRVDEAYHNFAPTK